MALDPVAFLVTPKLAAMVVMMPCLAMWSDLMGVTGGALFGVTGAGFTFGSYFAGYARGAGSTRRDHGIGQEPVFRCGNHRCWLL